MKRARKHSQQSGFTLIEVILAISILAVMVTLNYQMLRGVVRAKELIEDRRDAMYIANSLLTRLSRELQLAVKNPQTPLFSCPTGVFAGAPPTNPGPPHFFLAEVVDNSPTIRFIAKGAGQQTAGTSGQTGIVMLEYSVKQDPERSSERDAPLVLLRSETPASGPANLMRDCQKEMHFPITNNLISFSARFYDGQSKQWSTEWDTTKAANPPHIVEFTVVLQTPRKNQVTHTSAVRVASRDP